MRQYLIAYFASLTGFVAIDALWLSNMASRIYKPQLGGLALENFSITPAVAFYLLYGVGLVVFAVMPGVGAGRIGHAAAMGALFGLVAYATYDLTNLATLKGWPLPLTLVDLAWGTFATSVAAGIGAAATLYLTAR